MNRHFLHLFRLLESILHLIDVELQQSVTHVQKYLKEGVLKIEELIIQNNMPSKAINLILSSYIFDLIEYLTLSFF